ncbi:hypothetical protein B0H14DRAFT_2895220 [Mycena olivaceomarginata]|nr:hypothetical protein B0H14DRAFT_2895220 [Mycena olivaceomarginata]
MEGSNAPRLPIPIYSAIHPDNRKSFKALASSSKDIRDARHAGGTLCTTCFKSEADEPGLKLSRCRKCKGAWYCSKRPEHKKWCTELLNMMLQACFILHFDLLSHPQLDKPFIARVDIGVEPADLTKLLRIFMGETLPKDEKILGMIQVNGFSSVPPEYLEEPRRLKLWCDTRQNADDLGHRDTSIGLVEFGKAGSEQTIMSPIHIGAAALDFVRRATPWERTSAVTGEIIKAPFNLGSCLEFINEHIVDDKKNQLLLRTEMTNPDIEVIYAAARNENTTAAQLLRAKVARDQIYKPVAFSQGVAFRLPLV